MTDPASKEWSLKELAKETGVPERTIRFYISRGLVDPPLRAGRDSAYGEAHRARILKIRELKNAKPESGRPGLMLADIKRQLASRPAQEEPAAKNMTWFEEDGSPILSDRAVHFEAYAVPSPAASLPEPEIWRSYEVAPDIRVMIKSGAKPWRLRGLMSALLQFASAVNNPKAKEDQGE